MTQKTTSITIEGPENLVAHIKGLQDVLTQRNKQIEALQGEIARLREGKPTAYELQSAYQRGLKDANAPVEEALSTLRNAIAQVERWDVRKDRYPMPPAGLKPTSEEEA